MGVPLYRWMVYFMENPTKMGKWMNLGVALFQETAGFGMENGVLSSYRSNWT